MRVFKETPWWGWLLVIVAFFTGVVVSSFLIVTRQKTEDVISSRRQAVLIGCMEANARHDATIDAIDELISRIPPGPRRERAVSGRANTVFLINALAPKRDCEAYVERLTRP